MKDPRKVSVPGGNRIFIALRIEEFEERILVTLLVDISLDLCDSSEIESLVSGPLSVRAAS